MIKERLHILWQVFLVALAAGLILAVVLWCVRHWPAPLDILTTIKRLMTLDRSSPSDWAMVLITLTLGVIALFQLRASVNISRRETIMDAIQIVNERYQNVAMQRCGRSANQLPNEEIHQHFQAYWSVQLEQWMYFALGSVPSQILCMFALNRVKSFASQRPVFGGYSEAQGWELVRDEFSQFGRFCRFVDALVDVSERTGGREELRNSTIVEVMKADRLAKRHERALLRRVGRRRELRAIQWFAGPLP